MAKLYELKPGFSLMAGFMVNAIFQIHGETFKRLEGLTILTHQIFMHFWSGCPFCNYCIFGFKTVFSDPKGTVAWDGSFGHSVLPYRKKTKDLKSFWFLSKFHRGRLIHICVDFRVFSIYGKKISVHYPYTLIFFTRPLHVQQILLAYSVIAYVKESALKSSYSLCTLKYFWSILHVRYFWRMFPTTFRSFSEYAKRFQNTQK